MGTDNPAWVPGEVEREGLGTTGLYGELPAGIGPLMDLASALIHQAFTAHKSGDRAACDAFIVEGQNACGGVFQMNAEYVVRWPNHTDDPAWMAFLAYLATKIGPFVLAAAEPSAPPSPPPPRQVESEADFLKRLSRIRAEAEARHAKVTPTEADELRAMGLM